MAFGPWLALIGNQLRLVLGNAFPSVAADSPLGGWNVGDICLNNAPGPVGPFAWVCTTAGSPGTWTPLPTTSQVTTITGSGNTITTNMDTIVASTGGGAVTAALPLATAAAGKQLMLIRNGASNATFTGSVDAGTTSVVLATNYAAVILKSDGTQWYSVGPKGTVTIT